ncbi:hypothetical protein [Parvibaculum sp.]|uniref:hypothetical protein n=1 Tax=Parvibaculum sp. TaxID=2024848 RepID=UPI002731FA86|nr:hypothetical protein [Parvibaculum sp.]MDP1628875.1 hypothetical protein [Parvibaculum sp.]MDP2148270.1 hypothetical protein [Parvibaculum sp.]MDP3327733.1 hypothetical protein [Parvibaculum sp.]
MTAKALENAVALAAADIDDDRAAGPWWPAGPFREGNAVRQIFGSGGLDGGTVTLEACMNDHTENPNEEGFAPAAGTVIPVALGDGAALDLADVHSALVITRAHWLRVVVTGAGAVLDTKWWLK